MLQAKLDELGKAGWSVVVAVALWAAWPLALLMLAHLAVGGRLRAWWHELKEARFAPRGMWIGPFWRDWAASSGNRAFDGYHAETLRRLDEDGRDFRAYLERLRRDRDKAEFDRFMSERRASERRARAAPSGAAGSDPGDAATHA